jgi:nicotinate phosphoribosyltransferase
MGTSNVAAGKRYGIPLSGTMAHSFITAFEQESDAFEAFVRSFPKIAVLLIDTYDTVGGAHKAALVARQMESRGERLRGVRLDSGDIAELSKEVRHVFREVGLDFVNIFASGGLDEFGIATLLERGAEIDAFGVGTKFGVSADAPWSDMAYKLVSYNGRPVLKLSPEKRTLAGEKQVCRVVDS